ncbi:hypothetical protein R3P38DRAFT_2903729 [Favolaschia claudopus]|uniref:DUF6593 domain-containing protein n=1 Tax=Favolaschia claudopus TaxID=2862362 RepID=A0AAW0CE12_9AGAR
MLLKFTSQDLFNTALVDVATTQPVFHLSTNVLTAGPSSGKLCRETEISDAAGRVVATIEWMGRVPQKITLFDECVGGLVDLFASNTVQIIPKQISIATRFDTEYFWTATPDSVYLLDYDSNTRMAQLHIRAPALKATHAPISGRGSTYLELSPHPQNLASQVEILVSLLMMDILRRGRFDLPAYSFGPPSRLQQAWARLRPRRNTI